MPYTTSGRAEIRIRAERRLGKMIREQKEIVGLNKGSCRRFQQGTTERYPPTLADAGIDNKLTSQAQKLVAVLAAMFEGVIGGWCGHVEKETGLT